MRLGRFLSAVPAERVIGVQAILPAISIVSHSIVSHEL